MKNIGIHRIMSWRHCGLDFEGFFIGSRDRYGWILKGDELELK